MKITMMRQNKISRSIGSLLMVFLFSLQSACGQEALSTQHAYSHPIVEQPFPTDAQKFQARLFELIDAGGARFDAEFAARLDKLVEPQLKGQKNFLERISSGPATKGRYFLAGNQGYIYYGICQAHQCDNTTMELLFDPVTKRMVGKLLDRCAAHWLGQPSQDEQKLIEQRHRVAYPGTESACGSK